VARCCDPVSGTRELRRQARSLSYRLVTNNNLVMNLVKTSLIDHRCGEYSSGKGGDTPIVHTQRQESCRPLHCSLYSMDNCITSLTQRQRSFSTKPITKSGAVPNICPCEYRKGSPSISGCILLNVFSVLHLQFLPSSGESSTCRTTTQSSKLPTWSHCL